MLISKEIPHTDETKNEDDLVDFIDSEMQKEGLDLNNRENLDSYLNPAFM